MLLQLNIKNFALIEEVTINFEKGFNVLFGETGAGKSILIDAINYVLGGKSSRGFIRTGEKSTYVEAVFTMENDKTESELKNMDIGYEDYVIVSRETFKSGKNIAKVNGKAVLISALKNISETLIDIHGQHENQNLLDPLKHIEYLDDYCEDVIFDVKKDYTNIYQKLKAIDEKIRKLKDKNGENGKLADFLKYQINEIDSSKLKIGEDEELEERYSIVSNSEALSKVFSEATEVLYDGSENSKSVYDLIGYVVNKIKNVENNNDKIESIVKNLQDSYYSIGEVVEEIKSIKSSISFDENELDYINSRLFLIDNHKKKYGSTIQEILNFRDKLESQYNEIVNSEEIIRQLEEKRKTVYNELLLKAKNIHKIRCQFAEKLEASVKGQLDYVGLGKSTFKINVDFDEKCINESGSDKVQFLISTNIGEPLRPLEKVVSGGELSRIMLSIKAVFVNKDKIPSVIFDEIDTGISGRIAERVADKMYAISENRQVFCVTHLPQIACMSDVQFMVSKNIRNDKTYTDVKSLNADGKMNALAMMIGGSKVTEITREHAKEMISIAQKRKSEIIGKIIS
ncbi:DNA repair protein RecN [Clostridium felsineum]|uniref:DNA repair protein RecN n=1 Tax=Clostridium felsineum TaxID=36839 RepID=A0A1S8M9Y4_9CLOT|nr:DNA repair protein RecN [Clostridium felsineum]MCR3760212.1 DNA repair protein RecN [Clostridium felsineum]URZ06809.1 DNA repair protein RecN [Clostridium felsineum]URZ11841.1 DNA repair protein RecN [Clostridium felsineum]URZ16366.1 DNA repair protein RecN [Clostridium felsineum DSM 794]